MVTPERSLEQRRTALVKANNVRTYRANLKRDIFAGKISVISLIEDPPEQIKTMHIFDLLLAVPKVGRVKVNKLLSNCRISPSKTVEGMSDRQRDELIRLLYR